MNTNKHKLKKKADWIWAHLHWSFACHSEAVAKAGHSDFGILMIRVNSCAFVPDFLQNQHAIAVAVEAIAFANRFLVRAQQKFAAGKRADQHQ
jgi:hypothetical protein